MCNGLTRFPKSFNGLVRKYLRFCLLNLVETFRELDVRTPRVDDERDIDAERIHSAESHGRLDPLPFEPAEKLLEVLHFESDVIHGTAGGGPRRRS